jgi:hypothetical protein
MSESGQSEENSHESDRLDDQSEHEGEAAFSNGSDEDTSGSVLDTVITDLSEEKPQKKTKVSSHETSKKAKTETISSSGYKSNLLPQAYASYTATTAEQEAREAQQLLRRQKSKQISKELAIETIIRRDKSYLCIFNEIYYNQAYNALNE